MRRAACTAALLALCAPACERHVPPTRDACRASGRARTARFIESRRPRYERAMQRTLRYLARFSIDPVELRRRGIKGRKKLVELLDAYVAIHRHARGQRRGELLERFRQAAAVTRRDSYHDMGTVGDKPFRQDATSYLRACYLMDRMGLDTRRYRAEIARIKPRLDAHMDQRGVHQRMVFAWYYRHFGLELPPALRDPFKASLVAARRNPYLLSRAEAYKLTHEVFVPFDYGGKLDSTFFSARDRAYLRRALQVQVIVNLARRNADLAGELLACLAYLGDTDLQAYRDGLAFLLKSQRPGGAFGDYERLRAKRGDRLEIDLYLHTTSVAMDILPLAFDGPAR